MYLGLIASAVINFSYVVVGMLRVLAKLRIIPGSNTTEYCNKRDNARTYRIDTKEIDLVKPQGKQIRAI